ncbi:MAG: ABC transporter permease [Spirochaetia bacterium]|nr:ABC transporter permease [Spirochaetia bacterium]
MELILEKINKIYIIAALGFKESVRKKLIFFLLLCCIVFTGSGIGCASSCMNLSEDEIKLQLTEQKKQIENMEASPDEKKMMLGQLQSEYNKVKEQGEKTFINVLYIVIFSMIAFWLFLIAAIFTPFLALNDFQTRTHVLLLSKSISRWEYLLGKFTSILTLMILNLILMTASSTLFLYLSLNDLGIPLLRSLLVFSQGLLVFSSMIIFLTLTAGRLPGIFLSMVITVLTVYPAISIIKGELTINEFSDNVFAFILGYGLPQYAVNYFYALSFSVKDIDFLKNLHKVGNNTGMISVMINFIWFIIFWTLSIFIFNKKDLET